MIRQYIILEDWNRWSCDIYYAVDDYYVEEILERLRNLGCSGEQYAKAERNLRSGKLNGGLTFSNPDLRASLMVIGLTDSPEQFQDTFDHEKGHLAKHITMFLGIDPFGEEAQYLAGEIGRQMFKVAKRFLCEHCRKSLKVRK